MSLKLRTYQTEAIASVWNAWNHGVRRPAIVLPTGMGKTVVFASMCADFKAKRPDAGVIIILVHRDELVNQAVAKIKALAPHLRVGIVKAEKNEIFADVIVASVQTLARERRREMLPAKIGLVIVDEAHHAAADSYWNVLNHAGCFASCRMEYGERKENSGGAVALGVTATMARNDRKGLGDIWEDVVYRKDIQYGILHGYLCDVKGKSVTVDGLDLASVARSRGDYQEGALGDALTESGAGVVVAEKYKELAGDWQGVAFWPTVATAYGMAQDFNAAGIVTEVITGKTPADEREAIYARVRAGKTQCLSNCMVLTEGFDMPQLRVAVIGRPTTSQQLYVQMAGRVLRPFPGKDYALLLDVMGVSTRLALASMVDLSESVSKVKDGESLAEAILREEEEAAQTQEEKYAAQEARVRQKLGGVASVEDVDLFHGSETAWLRTNAGCWFIPTRDWTVFLWPEPGGTFKIGMCNPRSAKGSKMIQSGLTLDYAMMIAEDKARDIDPMVSQRGASWRKTSKGSPAQIEWAKSLGIDGAEFMRRGELSDALSIAVASKTLDKMYAATTAKLDAEMAPAA